MSSVAFMYAADFSPARSASYSASLFDAGKPRLIACSTTRPSGEMRTMPSPAPCRLDAPSTKSFHISPTNNFQQVEGSDDALGSSRLLMSSSGSIVAVCPLPSDGPKSLVASES
ncbi:hypothetical protein LOK49_LG12G00039 [Camellia lanceoleosa]|uniref:Uncharacterized protein n=1 Tax=Camellia lanceoleosa TaxID=1840588 RepID=A0ACC0FT75_9ERIC|nr:hypothetical protein LOK49_LG12G00039 [Camellia lanceoleosa]